MEQREKERQECRESDLSDLIINNSLLPLPEGRGPEDGQTGTRAHTLLQAIWFHPGGRAVSVGVSLVRGWRVLTPARSEVIQTQLTWEAK